MRRILQIGSVVLFGVLMALFTNWIFAITITLGVVIHEYGHMWAMRKCGGQNKGMFLIPFIGGIALGSSPIKSWRDGFFIFIMGPVFGLGTALVPAAIFLVTHNTLYGLIAIALSFLNAFNLIPVNPLDGGQILKSFLFSVNKSWAVQYLFLSMVLALLLSFQFGVLLLGIIIAFLGYGEYRHFRQLLQYEQNKSYLVNDLNAAWKSMLSSPLGRCVLTKVTGDPKLSELKREDLVQAPVLIFSDEELTSVANKIGGDNPTPMESKEIYMRVLWYFVLCAVFSGLIWWLFNETGVRSLWEALKMLQA